MKRMWVVEFDGLFLPVLRLVEVTPEGRYGPGGYAYTDGLGNACVGLLGHHLFETAQEAARSGERELKGHRDSVDRGLAQLKEQMSRAIREHPESAGRAPCGGPLPWCEGGEPGCRGGHPIG
jgi:hypothetical protein